MDVDDDMGGLNNLIQVAEDLEAEDPIQPAQVIDATHSSDSSNANAPEINKGVEGIQVEVFIPQNNGQPMHFI